MQISNFRIKTRTIKCSSIRWLTLFARSLIQVQTLIHHRILWVRVVMETLTRLILILHLIILRNRGSCNRFLTLGMEVMGMMIILETTRIWEFWTVNSLQLTLTKLKKWWISSSYKIISNKAMFSSKACNTKTRM